MTKLASLLAAFLLTSASLAWAGTPTDAYLATRDKAVAELAGPQYTDADAERERQALKALDPMIRALVGPVHVPGFLPPGKPNVDQVSGGVGFGKLDGIVLASGGGKAFAIVSTVPLLDAWRKVPGLGHSDPFRQPGDFITSAVANDSSAEVVARIPVAAHGRGDRVGAVLMLFAQDLGGTYLPDKVAVTVIHGGQAFLVIEEVVAAPIPECVAAFERQDAAARAGGWSVHDSAANRRMSAKVQAAIDRYEACLSARAPSQPWFRRASERAQVIVDLVSDAAD